MMTLLAQGDSTPTVSSDATIAWGILIVTLVVVGYLLSKFKRASFAAATGDTDVDGVMQKVLPEYRRYRPFFRGNSAPASEAALCAVVVKWAADLRYSNMAITEKTRCEMAASLLATIHSAGRDSYQRWIADLVPKYLAQLERAIPDVHELYALESGLEPPKERVGYAYPGDEERDQWMAGPQKYPVALDLYIGLQNLQAFTESEIERRFGEIAANYQKMKQRQADGDPRRALMKAGEAYLKVARNIYEDSKRLSFFWSAHTRPDRGQDFLDRITACVAEAMLAGRDIRAPGFNREVLRNVNRQFLDEVDCRFRGAFVGWRVWPTIVAPVTRAVPEAFRESDESDQPLTEQVLAVEAARWACDRLPELMNYPQWGEAVFDFTRIVPPELVEHLVAFASAFAEDRKRKRIVNQAAADAVRASNTNPIVPPAPTRSISQTERTRRDNASHQAELAFVDHAADVKGVFGLRDFEQWRNANLADDLAVDAVEGNASAFPTLMKKHAVHRRLRTLYDEFADEVEESYSRAMLDNYIRTRLSVENELEDVVAAAMELESRLVTLSVRVKRDHAIEKLKATKREMEKRAEGVDALASAVGELELFDERERQELQRMAVNASDRAKESVFSDLLRKETGDVVRQLSRES